MGGRDMINAANAITKDKSLPQQKYMPLSSNEWMQRVGAKSLNPYMAPVGPQSNNIDLNMILRNRFGNSLGLLGNDGNTPQQRTQKINGG